MNLLKNDLMINYGKYTVLITFFQCCLLIIATIFVYYPIVHNDFIFLWDDQWQVFCATTENGFNWDNIKVIFMNSFYNQYFPVNQFFYMLLFSITKNYNPLLFHLFSLLIHIMNVLLVYMLFIRLFYMSGRIQMGMMNIIVFITALLFAIHPLNVESVAWISASKILLYTLFYLLGLFCYTGYIKTKKILYYCLTLLLFLLSFGGKEQAVVFPASLLLIDWLLNRNLKDSDLWLEKFPFILMAFLLSLITLYVSHGGFSFDGLDYSIWERIVFCCYSFFEYLFKWIFPIKLLYLYPFPFLPGETMPIWLYIYPILFVVVIVSFYKILVGRWPVIFGLLFFIINIFMTLHIIPMPRFAIVADRYIYLSSVGLSFVMAFYLVEIYYKLKNKFVVCLLFSIYILCIGIYANSRTKVWNNSDTLKKDVREFLKKREKQSNVSSIGETNIWYKSIINLSESERQL